MTVESPKNLVPKFFDKTASTYDRIAAWTTFGKDRYWKKEILKHITKGNTFLDLACGTGILTRKIAEKFPNSKIVGVDITESYLDVAKRNSKSFKNILFVHQDAETLNLDLKCDCITSSYIPKYCDAKIIVKNCVTHLNSGGKVIFHDFIYPTSFFSRKIWNAYFVLLNFIGMFIPSWKEAFGELPKLIRTSNWLLSYADAMKTNGLEVSYKHLTCDTSAILIGTKID